MASRELFECRASRGQGHDHDFLTVGSMGHCSQIAMGIAMAQRAQPVYCLDGDGAVIMHMGSLAVIGTAAPANFKHLIINNGAHDSVGGQPTCALQISLTLIAQACGYKLVRQAESQAALVEQLDAIKSAAGPALLEIRVAKGARLDLGRPTTTPIENKRNFMAFLSR